jgi:hypothetical protein
VQFPLGQYTHKQSLQQKTSSSAKFCCCLKMILKICGIIKKDRVYPTPSVF